MQNLLFTFYNLGISALANTIFTKLRQSQQAIFQEEFSPTHSMTNVVLEHLQWPLELDFFAAWDEAAGGCILRICEFLWSFWGFTIQIWSEPQVDGVLFIFVGT